MAIADNRLSITTGKLFRQMKDESFAAEEISAFHAPSECLGLVYEGSEEKSLSIILELFETEREYWEALEKSVDYKWIYNSGLITCQSEALATELWREKA